MIEPCIAIGTCDRHVMLRDLLTALAKPRHSDVLIIIVDNGAEPAEQVVASFRTMLDIHYEQLAEPGVSPVRNRALEIARDRGRTHLIFIDDDEYPTDGWLDALLAKADDADIVYGPVYPAFLAPPPKWVEQSGIFVRTGAFHGTGNTLIALSRLPQDRSQWFRAEFSASGGEDFELLHRLEESGARVAVANDALVYEQIPPSRMTLRFVLRRGLRDGSSDANYIRLKRQSLRARFIAISRAIARKLVYAINHAFWGTLGNPWRFYMMAGDLATIGGLVATFAGARPRFYGRVTKKPGETGRMKPSLPSVQPD